MEAINWLELRAAHYTLLKLASPGDEVQLHLDHMIAIAYIRKMGGAHSLSLCKESHLLWRQAIRRNLTFLPHKWISTQENTEADFLSRHRLQWWDFKLALSEFWRIYQRLHIWPTLDAFASSRSHQIPRYMTSEQDSRIMAINAQDYYWDPVTWLFPLVPLIFSSTGGSSRAADQGDSDLSTLGGSNVVASVGLTKDRKGSNPSAMPVAVDCLRFPKNSREELFNLDPLYTFHISGKVI